MDFGEYGREIKIMQEKTKEFSSEFLNSYDSLLALVKDTILDDTNVSLRLTSNLESVEYIFTKEMLKLIDYFDGLKNAYEEILNQQGKDM